MSGCPIPVGARGDGIEMIHVYINYPNTRASAHSEGSCSRIQQAHKHNQRVIEITRSSLGGELVRLESDVQFGSSQSVNDVWLRIDLGDIEFEHAVAKHVLVLLGRRYRPFASVELERHC